LFDGQSKLILPGEKEKEIKVMKDVEKWWMP